MIPHQHLLRDDHSPNPSNPLRQMFHELVGECYARREVARDTEMASYVADVLTEFSSADKLYPLRDAAGRPVCEIAKMMVAADPVHGTAASFDEERKLHKHIGDYTLFSTGMFPKPVQEGPAFREMVRAGKESYYVVSQFNVFEYAREAPLFGRLSTHFEECVAGLREVYARLNSMTPRLLM